MADSRRFINEVILDHVEQSTEATGGVGKIVYINKSNFGKRKYNRGHREKAVSLRCPSRLTGAGSLLPPVYSEAWAIGIPRTPFSSLRDAAQRKHAGRKTNGVTQTQIKQQKSKDLM
ncbi:hypothetical protein TNCV_2489781 [Trichonephila clavipes]|nr:hypothetical protein TNCV_2489781 [Trichonephila clavipes]